MSSPDATEADCPNCRANGEVVRMKQRNDGAYDCVRCARRWLRGPKGQLVSIKAENA